MQKRENCFADMTVLDLKNYLREKNSIIIPVGIIEQHGHHLPTFTDSIIAEGLSSMIAKRLDILYTPVLYCSYSGGCLPGTINFSPTTLILCLKDMCISLAAQGFKNIFILLGHGGSENLKVLESSLHLMIRENPIFNDVMVVFTPFWRYCDKFMEGFYEGDGHGGNGETSFILYFAPHLVSSDTVDTDSADVLEGMKKHPDFYQKHEKPYDHKDVLPKITQKDNVMVGVMGDIGGASRQKGEEMAKEAEEKLSKFFLQCIKERKNRYFEIQAEIGKVVV